MHTFFQKCKETEQLKKTNEDLKQHHNIELNRLLQEKTRLEEAHNANIQRMRQINQTQIARPISPLCHFHPYRRTDCQPAVNATTQASNPRPLDLTTDRARNTRTIQSPTPQAVPVDLSRHARTHPMITRSRHASNSQVNNQFQNLNIEQNK